VQGCFNTVHQCVHHIHPSIVARAGVRMLQSCTRLYALQCPIASSTWRKHRTKVGTNSDHRLFLISIFSTLSFSILPTHLSYFVLANLSIPHIPPIPPAPPILSTQPVPAIRSHLSHLSHLIPSILSYL
jgi:hypothetical protein